MGHKPLICRSTSAGRLQIEVGRRRGSLAAANAAKRGVAPQLLDVVSADARRIGIT